MKTKQTYNGVEQLKGIIAAIMEQQDYPSWNFLNGVLSCQKILGEYELWLHWGSIRIVPAARRYEDGLTAGQLEILESWEMGADGMITLKGRRDDAE